MSQAEARNHTQQNSASSTVKSKGPKFIVLSAKARALAHHRYHVTYEDITALAIPVLRHRILLNFHAESDRIEPDEILRRLLAQMPPPSGA